MNNYTDEERDKVREVLESAKYGVFGYEIAPTTGTPHLQGYVHFNSPRYPSAVKKSISDRLAIFYCDASEEANIKYCKKDGNFEEFHPENAGKPQGGAVKERLRAVSENIRNNGPKALTSIVQEEPDMYVRYHRGLQALATAVAEKRRLAAPPECHWAIGDPGSGKSTFIHEMAEHHAQSTGESIYYWGANWPWADGYTDEKIIVIDDIRDKDFKGCAIPVAFMTKMIDRFPHMVQTKGGNTQFLGATFYCTSVMHPGDMWNKDPQDPVTQLLRRITHLYHCKKTATGYTQDLLGNGLTPRPAMLIVP